MFLAFGGLKFFPGASSAEALVVRTIDTLSLGVVSGNAALLLTAMEEQHQRRHDADQGRGQDQQLQVGSAA